MSFYSEKIFPRIFDRVARHKTFDAHRAHVLTQVQGKTLEIGIGTGINLNFYPAHVREIWGVDPSPGMEKQLKKKLPRENIAVKFHLTGAETLPFEKASFQTVVSTLTLCSLPDVQGALKEIRRVLIPNGCFVFLDHGLSPDPWTASLQKIFDPIQKKIACGCRLTVDVEKELKEARFEIISLNKFYLDRAPRIMGYVYEGLAKSP